MVAISADKSELVESESDPRVTWDESRDQISGISRFMSEMYVVDGRSFPTLAAAASHSAKFKPGSPR